MDRSRNIIYKTLLSLRWKATSANLFLGLKNAFFVHSIAKYHKFFVQGEAGVPWNKRMKNTVRYAKKSRIHGIREKGNTSLITLSIKFLNTKKQMSSLI